MKDTLIVNLYGGPGTGKCFGKGTNILMADGAVKPVEDIKLGDYVMGDDSTPRKVLELHHGHAPLYLLRRSHSQDIIVSESHISRMRSSMTTILSTYSCGVSSHIIRMAGISRKRKPGNSTEKSRASFRCRTMSMTGTLTGTRRSMT